MYRRQVLFGLLLWAALDQGAANAAEPIKVGAVFTMSGLFASAGQDSKNGAQLAAELINQKGGIKSLGGAKLELIFGDSQSKPASAASETERLITQQKVSLMMGSNVSADTIPLTAVSERYGMPALVPISQAQEITSRGFKWLWSLGLQDPDYNTSAIAALSLVQQQAPKLKRIAFVHGDNETGQSAARSFKELIGKEGAFEFVGDIEYSAARTQDFVPIVLKMRDAGVQMVVMAAYLREVIGFARAFDQLDYHPVWVAMSGSTSDPKFGAQVGASSDGVINVTAMGLDLPYVTKVDDLYQARFNNRLSSMAAATFDATNVLAQALEKAGSRDPEMIAQGFRQLHMSNDGLVSSHKFVEFDQVGLNKGRRAMLTQWQDGKLVTIWPSDIAVGSLLLPAKNLAR